MASAASHEAQPIRRVPFRMVTLIALLDLAARAAVPGALLALAHALNDAALVVACGVNVLAVVRGVLSGRLISETLRTGWRAFVGAARRHSVTALRTRSAEQSAAMFVEATHRTAMTLAQVLPRILADVLGLLLCALAVTWLLGATWLLAGAGAVVLAGPALLWVQRRLRAHEQRSFDLLSELSLDVSTLLQAPAELRAHGREQAFAQAMLQRSARMAAAMQRTHQLSSLLSLLPVGVALVVALVPLREGGWLSGQLRTVAEAGVLGAAAVSFAISLVRSAEAWSRSQPQRDLYARFVRVGGTLHNRAAKPDAQGWRGVLELSELQLRYDGAAQLTPGPTSHRWQDAQGLALLGPNGAGKSSLALALLGLLAPDSGTIRLADKPLDELRDALTPHVIYLPQSPFVEPSRSVAWHLQLVLGDTISDEALREALGKTGLWPLLERRARRRGVAPLELTAGELSGGEQQRMHLARAFTPHNGRAQRLVILDEPEAALDSAGRQRLAQLLDELATQARVLIIAHDPSVVPASFDTLQCSAKALDPKGAPTSA